VAQESGAASAIETALRTALALTLIPVVLVLYSTTGIALAAAGVGPVWIHRLYVSFARLCLLVGGTRLLVRGAEHVGPGQACVVVPNHESGWDPLCLLVALPRIVLRFVAKRQFMDIPLIGEALRRTGNIRVVRTRTAQDVERIHAAMDARDPEISILFFAEGTRSRDGGLHAFKPGAFVTAIGYGLPILPVGIAGTRSIWTRGIVRVRRGTVAIEVGEPIPVAGLSLADRERLRERTFEAVAELRSRARRRLREAGVDPGGVD
jgi:1-acyl-sn-glycerol-3-phosphate acyltransferase